MRFLYYRSYELLSFIFLIFLFQSALKVQIYKEEKTARDFQAIFKNFIIFPISGHNGLPRENGEKRRVRRHIQRVSDFDSGDFFVYAF